ncbi:hypothetical protein F2P81_012592 [Scophthalmus maximus]|uniref:TNFR-Cys domain-containing protein n=1 Tax=Scophthalmus maximus TaxID=52904 RepID=A0A6A4SUU9_SCOMX|nr:hypothetical protein F2P81_012592 [Scophthalmus maximus]
MVLINLLFFLLTFYQLIGDLDATLCPKGQGEKRINGHSICEVCTDEHYRPEKNKSPDCSQCTKCDGKRWSHIKQKCTKETDTICQCRGDFVPLELDSSTCKCDIGFGLRNGGMVLVMLGIVGLLLLTAVTCKLHINPCEQRKPAVQSMVLVMLGIVGLLLLTAVTCKLHINPCEQRKPAVQSNHVEEFCTQHKPTVCSPCGEGFFSNHSTVFAKCEECQSCQHEYAEKCTATTNAKCSCLSGFLCSDNVCSTCEENKCVTGEKVYRTDNNPVLMVPNQTTDFHLSKEESGIQLIIQDSNSSDELHLGK